MQHAPKYVAYYRVSTPRQGVSGLGLEAQRAAALRHIGAGEMTAEYTEVESGKRNENRPQLKAAIEHCRRGRSILLIASLDRLARNVHFISGLMESGVPFVAADMPHATPFEIHIRAAMAEEEGRKISQRTKSALAAAKARGVKLGNPRLHEARLRALIVLRGTGLPESTLSLLLEWWPQKTYTAIAALLNSHNITTPRGNRWYASTVRAAILRNLPEAYTSHLKGDEKPGIPSFTSPSAGRGPVKEGGMPMPSNLSEANRMLDLFTSVGARSFVVTKTDVNQNVIWGKSYQAAELRHLLPAMVRTAAIRRAATLPDGQTAMAGENLIVRPTGPNVSFIQLDDLSADQLDRVRPAAFVMLETSPGNHQAWIAASGVPAGKEEFKAFVRRVRKAVGGNDKSASHATRVAGTENFKPKYGPDYPVVTVIHALPGRVLTPERLHELALLAEPEASAPFVTDTYVPRKSVSSAAYDRPWPSYAITLSRTRPKKDGSGPDRSLADFNFAMVCCTGGKSIEDTITKLMEVSENAQQRAARGDDGYARITVENAAAAVARNFGRARSRA